jgi:hypothetical protein
MGESDASFSSTSSGCSTSTTGEVRPTTIAEALAANVGRRVKLVFGLQTTFFPFGGSEITARIVSVGSDFVVIDRICFEGRPILDPRRITFRIDTIDGVQRLKPEDELVGLLCALD